MLLVTDTRVCYWLTGRYSERQDPEPEHAYYWSHNW